VERLVELHAKYLNMVKLVNKKIQQEQQLQEEEFDDEYFYLQKLDGGLFTLQLIDFIILNVGTQNDVIKEKIEQLLDQQNMSVSEIKIVVEEYCKNIGSRDEKDEIAEKEKKRVQDLIDSFFK